MTFSSWPSSPESEYLRTPRKGISKELYRREEGVKLTQSRYQEALGRPRVPSEVEERERRQPEEQAACSAKSNRKASAAVLQRPHDQEELHQAPP